MSECVLNVTKINTNGLPDFEKAIEVIDKIMSNDAEFMPVVTKAIHECAKKSKELEPHFLETMKAQDDGEKVCHPQSGFLIGCFYGKVFTSCPASRWTSSKIV
jgi:tetrahydromethanopterin S-methyltransferase subunit A